jgi:protein-S-isoprenylcysteine O-methyltransferase Ste14
MINKREHKDFTSKELAKEIEKIDKHTFPIVTVTRKKVKEMMTNKKITQIVGVALVILMVCAGMYSTIGESHAERKKDFPIFSDETGVYAVVYNNGEVLVLKAANIEGTTIEINTRQQKIVSCMDVAYEICIFETVIVTGKDGGKQ